MKTLQINVPKGYEIDKEKSTFENIVFKEVLKDIRSRIQSVKDIFTLNNTTEKEFNNKWKGFEDFEKAIAFEILMVAAYNEGKTPDWQSNDSKVIIYKNHRTNTLVCDVWNYYASCFARLFFVGKDAVKNAQDAISKFSEQLHNAKSL